jgi:hypothetical protein
MANTYVVEVLTGEDPDAAKLKERFERACRLRLESLEKRGKAFPKAGGALEILDNFEGKLVAERSEAEVEEEPPTEVSFTIERVEPAKRPAKGAQVRVVLRLEY